MASVDETIRNKVKELKDRFMNRDAAMMRVRLVREGKIELLSPESFSEQWPKSVIANFIDVSAQDTSEMLAPLPALNCASGAMRSEADKMRAAKKNKIGTYYWEESRLPVTMFAGSDQFLSYGFLPFYCEPDYDRNMPIICVEDPLGAYYENDRYGRTRVYVKTWQDTAGHLAILFPEHAGRLLDAKVQDRGAARMLDVTRYCDDMQTVLYVGTKENVMLARYENTIGRCPARIAEWPSLTGFVRGRFDDLIWVQLARAVMALLAMEAGWEAVNAPIILPRDANEISIGPKAIIRTDGRVGRAPLEIPQSAFAIESVLAQELQQGARYPGARSGQVNASVITGRGVQELLGSFDSQIKKAQVVLGDALRYITSIAFEMDETVFGNAEKTINGVLNGETFQFSYNPAKDIAGNYMVDVSYGFAAGLSPQSAVVMMLQLRGDNLISRDTVRRQLPWAIDAEHEQRVIDIQETEDALKQGLYAYGQALGPAIQAGQDPNQIVGLLAEVIKGRRNGRDLATIVSDYYTKLAEEAAQAAQEQAQAGGLPPGAAPPGMEGVGPNGLSAGVAEGQAGMPPGGLAGLVNLMAGGGPGGQQMSATVSKRLATG